MVGNAYLHQYVQSLCQVLYSVHRFTADLRPAELDTPEHLFQPGDSVLMRTYHDEILQPKWEGAEIVVLSTLTALKVTNYTS